MIELTDGDRSQKESLGLGPALLRQAEEAGTDCYSFLEV